jgi:SAM-dependent methyltransferase
MFIAILFMNNMSSVSIRGRKRGFFEVANDEDSYRGVCAHCGKPRRNNQKLWRRTGRAIPYYADYSKLKYYTATLHNRLCNTCARKIYYKKRRCIADKLPVTADKSHERIKRVYQRWKQRTRMLSGCDAFTDSALEHLQRTAGVGWGEITMASIHKLLDLMYEFQLNRNSHFFDIGSGYGRAVVHVTMSTGARSTGIEVVNDRVNIANELLRELGREVTDQVKFLRGDIADNLFLLFDSTHILMFDYVFTLPLKMILLHFLSAMSGTKLKLILSTIKVNQFGRWQQVDQIQIRYGPTTTLYAYKRLEAHEVRLKMEVSCGVDNRILVRACRRIQSGECMIESVDGETCPMTAADVCLPAFTIRICDSCFHNKRHVRPAMLHIHDISRYIPVNAVEANVIFTQLTYKHEIRLTAMRDIEMHELLVLHSNTITSSEPQNNVH